MNCLLSIRPLFWQTWADLDVAYLYHPLTCQFLMGSFPHIPSVGLDKSPVSVLDLGRSLYFPVTSNSPIPSLTTPVFISPLQTTPKYVIKECVLTTCTSIYAISPFRIHRISCHQPVWNYMEYLHQLALDFTTCLWLQRRCLQVLTICWTWESARVITPFGRT